MNCIPDPFPCPELPRVVVTITASTNKTTIRSPSEEKENGSQVKIGHNGKELLNGSRVKTGHNGKE